jgi:alcohol dehydrogenase (NADP+)
MITGHEIVGHVAAIGPKVEGFKVGDRVGIGAMVGSCFDCKRCNAGYENYCKKAPVMTYNSKYPNVSFLPALKRGRWAD